MWRGRTLFIAVWLGAAGCAAPVQPPAPPSGQEIAFGGGSGGPADACFHCHGFRGEGDELAPRLAGQSAGYLIKQMEDYARRLRDDKAMSPVAARLTDGELVEIAAYYAAIPAPAAVNSAAATPHLYLAGDPERGLRACADCHGARGEGQGQAYPAIAGQPAAYIEAQLQAFHDRRRRNDPQDMMGAIARQLSAAEIIALAAWLSEQP